MIHRIVITGPESTGKSWLTRELSAYFEWPNCGEFARHFLEARPGNYTASDLVTIAQGQQEWDKKARQEAILRHTDGYFADTDLMTIEIWSEFVFGSCDPEIRRLSALEKADLFLLCHIDLPWEPDPLREHPDRREELFALYKRELEKRNRPYAVVSGRGNERLQSAVKALTRLGFPTSSDRE
jgi:nicotinamide riboside kinase